MNSVKISDITKSVLEDLNKTIVVLDVETTGFHRQRDRIIEFGAIKLSGGNIVDKMSILINPGFPIPYTASRVNNIFDDMVADREQESFYLSDIYNFLKDALIIVGHNISFDLDFIEEMFRRNGYEFKCSCLDTLDFARVLYNSPNYKLGTLAEYLGIEVTDAHRALADVETTVMLLRFICYDYVKRGLIR